jgi:hypothetical protein
MDFLWIFLLAVFYALLHALVRGCESLRKRGLPHTK